MRRDSSHHGGGIGVVEVAVQRVTSTRRSTPNRTTSLFAEGGASGERACDPQFLPISRSGQPISPSESSAPHPPGSADRPECVEGLSVIAANSTAP